MQRGGFIRLQNANIGAGQAQAGGERNLFHITLNNDLFFFAGVPAASEGRKAVIDAVAFAEAKKILNGKVSFLHSRQPSRVDPTFGLQPYHRPWRASIRLRIILNFTAVLPALRVVFTADHYMISRVM